MFKLMSLQYGYRHKFETLPTQLHNTQTSAGNNNHVSCNNIGKYIHDFLFFYFSANFFIFRSRSSRVFPKSLLFETWFLKFSKFLQNFNFFVLLTTKPGSICGSRKAISRSEESGLKSIKIMLKLFRQYYFSDFWEASRGRAISPHNPHICACQKGILNEVPRHNMFLIFKLLVRERW